MVAQTIKLPNVRRMFIPDPGYMLIDCDLERADAQVVAWDAGDEELKDMFHAGVDIHRQNAADVFGIAFSSVTDIQRQQAKVGVHAVNYGVMAKTLAENTGWTVAEAEFFITRWFLAHPKIKDRQDAIEKILYETRTITNAFGYKHHFFNRLSVKVFHEALAWIPQSTVSIATNLGLIAIDKHLPNVQLLNQVHDSLVMQVPLPEALTTYPKIIELMRVTVPYPDPLIIPISYATSELSWGDITSPGDTKAITENPDNLSLHALAIKFAITEEMVQCITKEPERYECKAEISKLA